MQGIFGAGASAVFSMEWPELGELKAIRLGRADVTDTGWGPQILQGWAWSDCMQDMTMQAVSHHGIAHLSVSSPAISQPWHRDLSLDGSSQ